MSHHMEKLTQFSAELCYRLWLLPYLLFDTMITALVLWQMGFWFGLFLHMGLCFIAAGAWVVVFAKKPPMTWTFKRAVKAALIRHGIVLSIGWGLWVLLLALG